MIKKIEYQAYIAKQKSILLAEKARVEEELKAINKFPQYGDTEEANAQEVERFEGYKGLELSVKTLLKDITTALDNIDNNKYGLCNICDNQIEANRLEVFPAALTCVVCSKKQKK
ncbi:MAG: hypothetical protein ACD_58C00177G0004 [uncultured bacterium]|nr:MAG: hypothetical protein ACD_58C00177G0004 [uncultured bacterium]